MKSLEVKNPEICNYFMVGNFSVQKRDILGVAIGCDHAGEQVNHEDKTRGGLKCKTRNHNNCNLHYLIAPVIVQLQEEMLRTLSLEKYFHERYHIKLLLVRKMETNFTMN